MAVAYQSQQEASNTTHASTLTITKPTSLAVGDLMVALLYSVSTTTNWATLSGWTLIGSTSESTSTTAIVTILAKVADSGDVAASNFTFTPDSSSFREHGIIIRYTGDFSGGIANLYVIDADTNISGTPTYTGTGGIVPIGNNSALLLGGVAGDGDVAHSNYAVTNNNPTWTERADGTVGATTVLDYFVATSTYAATTTTGNYSVDGSSGFAGIFLLSISESTNATGTTTLTSSTQTAFIPTGSAGTSGSTMFYTSTQTGFNASGRSTSPTQWTNESEVSTTWTNEESLS